jgi:hypothetical protein
VVPYPRPPYWGTRCFSLEVPAWRAGKPAIGVSSRGGAIIDLAPHARPICVRIGERQRYVAQRQRVALQRGRTPDGLLLSSELTWLLVVLGVFR